MKLTKSTFLAASCMAAFAFTNPAFAQEDASETSTQTTQQVDHNRKHERGDRKQGKFSKESEKIPSELRDRFKAAMEKIKDDPEVVAARAKAVEANKAVQGAILSALKKTDAEVAEAWSKIRERRDAKRSEAATKSTN